MEIYKRDLPDILTKLPNTLRFDAAQVWDVVICTLGFEDRSHAIIDQIVSTGSAARTILVLVRYPTNEIDNSANENFFVAAAQKMAGFYQITYTRREFAGSLTKTLNAIPFLDQANVLFDISSCSSYVFYPTINALIQRDINLTIGYVEADVYYPTKEEWSDIAGRSREENNLFVQSFENAGFQSLGVDDIYSHSIFSEMNPGSRPGLLIAVPNFSVMRMNAIKTRDRETNNTPYDGVYWVIGTPPGDQNKWRIEAMKSTHSLDHVANALIAHVSTFDYKEMLKTLENIWYEYRYKFYLSIGPLGSKMQHLGTFLFLYLHKDVGLWLAEPKEFRAGRFSTGCGSSWQTDFGNTKAVRELLDTYMTFEWKL
jgi:hypothetical protein